MSKFLKSNLVGEYGELGDATLIPPKSEGGGPAEVTPASIVTATGQMTPEQAAQTRENLEISSARLPVVSASDNGKFLRVVSGSWAAATVPSAETASF